MAEALEERLRELLGCAEVSRARRRIFEDDARTISEQRALTEIAAPPLCEESRATRMAELMAEAVLTRIETDREGNVLWWWGGGEAPLVLSAHLDTIFPQGTDVHVREEGRRLVGPGISDDGRGLAALLALARVIVETRPALAGPLLFAATVGEEGEGDLRGVRYLFRDGAPARNASAFLALDEAGLSRVVTNGLGSRRFRLSARGPGGHSWVDRSTPNQIHVLGRAVARFTELGLAKRPRTTLSVGRWWGGTSVSAIPQKAWVELEVRSASRSSSSTVWTAAYVGAPMRPSPA